MIEKTEKLMHACPNFCHPHYPCFIMFNVDRPKGKAPVGGISIFGAVTDELTGESTSAAPSCQLLPLLLPLLSLSPQQ